MFRNYLYSQFGHGLVDVQHEWSIDMPALIRVPFFDPNDDTYVYVVNYSESKRKYYISRIHIDSGNIEWEIDIVNGGYGTPVIFGDYIVALKNFSDIVAIDKKTGAFVWECKTSARIRSSLNVIDGKVFYTSGGELWSVDKFGNTKRITFLPGYFFFGTISKRYQNYLIIGTIYDSEKNISMLHLLCIDKEGAVVYKIELCSSRVISSDVSGFWLEGNNLIITAGNEVLSIDADSGRKNWISDIGSFCGRHVPVVDDEGVYITTINGKFIKLAKNNGTKLWEIKFHEEFIVSPPSIYDDTAFCLADCSLFAIDKHSGYAYSKTPIGHCPYSAPVINNRRLFIGGGEPPINGILYAFAIKDVDAISKEVVSFFEIGNYIENLKMSICIKFASKIKKATLDASILSYTGIIDGRKIGDSFIFEIPLKSNLLSGYYCMLITLESPEGNKKRVTVNTYLYRKNPLPKKRILTEYIQNTIQEQPLYSGAALAQMVLKKHGKEIEQKDFREMIDYTKEKSAYEDANFQTWRIMLRRVLSTQATTVEELAKSEEKQ